MPKTSTLLLFCLLMRSFAYAQLPQYHVQLITGQQGLNTADILDISKDREGFLWLLSLSSVQRFDGRIAKPFQFKETIRKIFIDDQNRKWVVGRTAVYLFKNEFDGFKEIIQQPGGATTSIAIFNFNQTICLLMADRLLEFNESSGKFIPFRHSFFSAKKLIPDMFGQYGDFAFTASSDTIYRLDMQSKQTSRFAFKSISYLFPLNKDALIVSDWNSRSYLISFSQNSIKEISPDNIKYANGNDFIRFFGAIEITKGKFFLSSNRGVVEYDEGRNLFQIPVIYYRGSPLINHTSIKTFYRDTKGDILMSHADGLAFFNPATPGLNYIRNYACEAEALPDIDIRCFTEDNQGNTWLGTINGIVKLNMQTGQVKNYSPAKNSSNNYPTIRDIIFSGKYIIAGTGSKGIMILNTETDQFSKPFFLPDSNGRKTASLLNEDFIWRIVQLQNGEILITGAKHFYLLNPATLQAKLVQHPIARGVSRSSTQDASRRIWHGTSIGLHCYDAQFKPLFSVVDSFEDKRLASFCEWKSNHMLVGGKGLFEIVTNGSAIIQFNKLEILPAGRFIYCMQKDAAGDVWLGTDEGLYRYNPLKKTIELFDAADNVQPQAFNSNGLYLSKNNLVFAGGKAGFNYFDPAHVTKKIAALYPKISALTIGNNDSLFFKSSQPYSVNYFDRSIIIHISTPEYLRPFALQYRYKLHDDDSAWIDNGSSNTVRMHNLPSGDYRFMAAASYDGKNWFTTKESISFIIHKPWWHQWWFRFICLAGLLSIAGIIYWYRRKQRSDRMQQQTIDYFANSGQEYSSTDDILWDITRNCISRLGFEDCVIYLVDEDRKVLKQRAAYGAKSPKTKEIINPLEIPVGKGITGHVAQTGKAMLVSDTSKDSRYITDDDNRLSELTVPIIHKEKIIGVIDSEHPQRNFFNRQHLNTLQTIASICASKISLAMAVEKMQHAIKEVDEVNTKMLETKFMNLRLQMNPHFLFNSLSSIQHLIVSKQTNEAYKYLSIFSNFLRSILQYADKTLITLDEELKMLEMYIKLESIGFDDSFSYTIDMDEELESEEIYLPPLLLQPLVENAIWHGLLHKQGAKHFSVKIKDKEDEQLLCIIEDNGVGRGYAAAIKQKNLYNSGYQSKATGLIKERLLLLKQKTGKPASIFTDDIINDHNEVAGTRVIITIPYYNNDSL